MKALWNRLKYTVQSDLHEWFDQKEEENPVKTLNMYLEQAEEKTEVVAGLLRRQARLVEQLEGELEQSDLMLSKRTLQLEKALELQEEELILFAEAEKAQFENRTAQLVQVVEEAKKEHAHLERQYATMQHKIEDMRLRQMQLMSRENVIRAERNIDELLRPEVETVDQMTEVFKDGPQRKQATDLEQRLEALLK